MEGIMKKIKQARVELIMLAIANIVLGVVLIANPNEAIDVIVRVIGIVLAAWGVIRIIAYFRVAVVEAFGSFGLVQGVALIAFGIYLCAMPDVMSDVFTVLVSILVVIGGVIKVQYAVDLKRMNGFAWWIELVVAVALIILGILGITDPFSTKDALMVFLGISLAIDGAFDLFSIIRISVIARKVGKEVKNVVNTATGNVIEGEVVNKDEQ